MICGAVTIAAALAVTAARAGIDVADDPAVIPADTWEDAPTDHIRYDRDRLTVSIAAMPLHAFLVAVGRECGAELRIDGLEERTVSDAFKDLPLEEALRRVLGGRNFTLVYQQRPAGTDTPSRTRLKEIRVYGSSGAVVTASPTRPMPPTQGPTAGGRGAVEKPSQRAPAKTPQSPMLAPEDVPATALPATAEPAQIDAAADARPAFAAELSPEEFPGAAGGAALDGADDAAEFSPHPDRAIVPLSDLADTGDIENFGPEWADGAGDEPTFAPIDGAAPLADFGPPLEDGEPVE
jgi:hypothetical protein